MIAYTVCCTTRSGSTFLCKLLESAGLGLPDEYFNSDELTGQPHWRRVVGVSPDAPMSEYLSALFEKRSKNGLFGIKTVTKKRHAEVRSMVAVKSILIRRRDTLRQAISMYRASYSGEYHNPTAEHRSVPFDADAIRAKQGLIERANGRWIDYLCGFDEQPHCVWYEDLVFSPWTEILLIRDFLGVDLPITGVSSDTEIMSDELTEDWLSRLK